MTAIGVVLALAVAAWVVAPVLRARATGMVCPRCGPRPEEDARYCSSCGAALGASRAAS